MYKIDNRSKIHALSTLTDSPAPLFSYTFGSCFVDNLLVLRRLPLGLGVALMLLVRAVGKLPRLLLLLWHFALVRTSPLALRDCGFSFWALLSLEIRMLFMSEERGEQEVRLETEGERGERRRENREKWQEREKYEFSWPNHYDRIIIRSFYVFFMHKLQQNLVSDIQYHTETNKAVRGMHDNFVSLPSLVSPALTLSSLTSPTHIFVLSSFSSLPTLLLASIILLTLIASLQFVAPMCCTASILACQLIFRGNFT